jgi:hypothetical protein
MQKVTDREDNVPGIQFTTDNAGLLGAIGSSCQVAAGTARLWARPDAFEALDVLFIDEAAQMSLANVLAVSQAAKSIVLLGGNSRSKAVVRRARKSRGGACLVAP